jgi:hypothetical protein
MHHKLQYVGLFHKDKTVPSLSIHIEMIFSGFIRAGAGPTKTTSKGRLVRLGPPCSRLSSLQVTGIGIPH